MKLPCLSGRTAAALALLWLLPFAAAAQTPRIAMAHFSPALADVRIDINGESPVTLDYADYAPWRPLGMGEHTLTARRSDGSVIVSQRIEVMAEDSITVFLAGVGTSEAPFALLPSLDHARPLLQGVTRQDSMFIVVDGQPAKEVRAGDDCVLNPEQRSSYSMQNYGTGTAQLSPRARSFFSLSFQSDARNCGYRLWLPNAAQPVDIVPPSTPQPGTRLRVVYAGDGVRQPFRTHVIVQEIAPEPAITASSEFDGLWVVPSRPGWIVLLGYEPGEAGARGEMRGYVLAENAEGDDLWLRLRNTTGFETVGGTPDGRAPTFDDRFGTLEIVFHSPGEASMTQRLPAYGGRNGDFDLVAPYPGYFGNDTVRLVKMLPLAERSTGGAP